MVITMFFLGLFCFLIGGIIGAFLIFKFKKPKTETKCVIDDDLMQDLINDAVKEAREEWEIANSGVDFVKLPVELRNYNKVDVKKMNKCKECKDKAEKLGVEMEKICPDLNCEEEENEYTVVNTFDYVLPESIKNFYSIDNQSINVAFYDGSVIRYTLSEKEFIEKLGDFINIID